MWHDNPFSFTYFNVRETDTTTLSWVPDAANDNADVSATYATDSTFDGTPPYGGPSSTTNTMTQNAVVDYWAGVQIPPSYYNYGISGPGPEPGGNVENSYTQTPVYNVLIYNLVPTSGGVTLPGSGPYNYTGEPVLPGGPPDPNSALFASPTLPSGVVGTLPAPADVATYSLPAAGEAVLGMDFAPVAGNGAGLFAPSFPVGGGPQALQTRFGQGNNPSSLPAFTSETIAGPFGRNSAAAFPMTHSSTLVNYGANGVSAATNAPATSPGGSIISVLPTIGGAAARAADQVLFGGWGGAIVALASSVNLSGGAELNDGVYHPGSSAVFGDGVYHPSAGGEMIVLVGNKGGDPNAERAVDSRGPIFELFGDPEPVDPFEFSVRFTAPI